MSTTGTGKARTKREPTEHTAGKRDQDPDPRGSRLETKSTQQTKAKQTSQPLLTAGQAAGGKGPAEPPITKITLSELDVQRIIFNPKLRHDVNFDPELHFRPNLDGEKGLRKSKRVKEFWNLLRSDLIEFLEQPETFCEEVSDYEWSLPATLRAIGEILATLVPPEDRSTVEEVLNVDMLIQQLSKGAADLEKLANWLSNTLKLHCAPMRDDWVDSFERELIEGYATGDISKLVAGLRSLLGVLEAMKLDVANHQIRCLRPLLIHDTVKFEQTFFLKKINLGKFDPVAPHLWFTSAEALLDEVPRKCESSLWIFLKGFINLLLPSMASEDFPQTFMFDEERLQKLRSEVSDCVHIEICLRLFRILTQHAITNPWNTGVDSLRPPSSVSSFENSGVPTTSTTSTEFERKVKEKSHQAKDTGHYVKPLFSAQVWIPNIDGEMPSQFLSKLSSPTVSRSNFVKSLPLSSLVEFSTSEEAENSPSLPETNLSRSIIAILDDTDHTENRWQSAQMVSAIAVEILRSVEHDADDLRAFEMTLSDHLNNPQSALFARAESHVLSKLYSQVDDVGVHYWSLDSMQLFTAATTPSNPVSPRSVLSPTFCPARSLQSLTINEPYGSSYQLLLHDVAKYITHIGILHWRVWAPLVYLVDPRSSKQEDTLLVSFSGGADLKVMPANSQLQFEESMDVVEESPKPLSLPSGAEEELVNTEEEDELLLDGENNSGVAIAKEEAPQKLRPVPQRQDSYSETVSVGGRAEKRS